MLSEALSEVLSELLKLEKVRKKYPSMDTLWLSCRIRVKGLTPTLRRPPSALAGAGGTRLTVRGYSERQVCAVMHHRLYPMACNVHSTAMPPPRVNKTLLVRQAIRAATTPATNLSLPNETSNAPFS